MKMSPCFGCEKRHPGCHGGCKDYGEWKAEDKMRREAIKQTRVDLARQYPAKAENKWRSRGLSET